MIYLSGKITSLFRRQQERNVARFRAKAQELRSLGLDVYNPIEGEPSGKRWEWYIVRDLLWIMQHKPKTLYLMRGWEKSLGARTEKELAELLNIKIVYERV